MTIQYTTNYHVAYADAQTALLDLATVTQQVAQSLDDAMGRAGYTPPDASSFAAEVAARIAVGNRVTTLEGDKTGTTTWVAAYSAAASTQVAITDGTTTEQRITAAQLNFGVPLTAGRVYRIEAQGTLEPSAAANAQFNIRAKSGAAPVTTTSTFVATDRQQGAVTAAGRFRTLAVGRFTVPATATYQFAAFLAVSAGTLKLITDARGLADIVITDAGPSAGLSGLLSIA
jgi:hypothetical protein